MTPSGHRYGNAAWILLLVLINLIVLSNALRHDPRVGYDAADHLKYIEVLAEYRLPARADTAEFFSPPLPYLLPALARATGVVSLPGAAKIAQLLNVLFSIGLTVSLVSLCDRVRPGDPWLKSMSLLFLGMLPVYYRTFAFVRGEPLLAFLCVFVVDRTLALLLNRRSNLIHTVALGAAVSLMLLSPHWGFFVLPAIALFAGILAIRRRQTWWRMTGNVVVIMLVAGLGSAWFYLHLRQNVGSARAFNRSPAPVFSLANKPGEFYFGTGGRALFNDPIRPVLGTQFFPIMHSEMWGDYWSAFIVRGIDTRDGSYLYGGALHLALSSQPPPVWLETNRFSVAPYLGRANLVALIPGAILLAGLFFGGRVCWRYAVSGTGRAASADAVDDDAAVLVLLFLVIGATLAGYGWFVLMYPGADTIKATYLLQIFPLLALISAEMLLRVRQRIPALWVALAAACVVAILHNAPLFFTRYPLAW